MLLLSSADLFRNWLFQKILSGTLSECQMVWIQIRTDILSVPIWVQTVCNGYQHTTKVAASMKRVNIDDAVKNVLESESLCEVL